MTEVKPRSLWLQLEGLLYPNNNEGQSLTGLENDTPHMHPELFEHLWVHFLPHPAGGKAASRVGPKIVLDHVCVYIYKLCLCALGFLTIGCIRCY